MKNNNSNNYIKLEEKSNNKISNIKSLQNHLIEIKSKSIEEKKSELYSILLFTLSMIMNGINHFHFKYMKKSIGLQNYNEFSFVLIRCIFIIGINYIKMLYNKETINQF